MKHVALMLIAAALTAPLAGCIVHTRDRHHHHHNNSQRRAKSRDCPPAYHWDGGRCVHNGRGHAKGHRK